MRVAVIVILSITILFVVPLKYTEPLYAFDEEAQDSNVAPISAAAVAPEAQTKKIAASDVLTGSAARAVVSATTGQNAPKIYFTRVYTLVPSTGETSLEFEAGYNIVTSTFENTKTQDQTNSTREQPTSVESDLPKSSSVDDLTPDVALARSATASDTPTTAPTMPATATPTISTDTSIPPATPIDTPIPSPTPTIPAVDTATPTPTQTGTPVPTQTAIPTFGATASATSEPPTPPQQVLIKTASKVALLPQTTPTVIELKPRETPAGASEPEAVDIAATVSAAETEMESASRAVNDTPNATGTPDISVTNSDEAATATCEAVAQQIEDPTFYRGSYRFSPKTKIIAPVDESIMPSAGAEGDTGDASLAKCEATPGMQQPVTAGLAAYLGFPRIGRAMYYNPGIMERVLSFRLQSGHVSNCEECVGNVALLDRSDLNRKVWLEWEDGTVDGPFLVIDVAARHHVDMLLQRHWVVDIDYQTARRIGMNRPLPVTVWDHPPL